jgi:hypothetical protein
MIMISVSTVKLLYGGAKMRARTWSRINSVADE